MNLSNKKIPVGAVTLSLLLLAGVMQFIPKDHCDELTNSLENGYFLRWSQPQLLLIRADKQTFTVNHEDKQSACYQLIKQLAQQPPQSLR